MSRRHPACPSDSLRQSLSNLISAAMLLLGLCWYGTVAAQVEPQDLPNPILAVHAGRLTANLDRAPLRTVLEELARRVHLRLLVSEAWCDHSVTAHFRALPLEEVLARLLAGHSYAFTYATAPSGEGAEARRKIVELIVLDDVPATKDAGGREATDLIRRAGSGTGSEQRMETTPEWLAALGIPIPAVRLMALDRVRQSRTATTGPASLDLLNRALLDPEETVRTRAQELAEQEWAATAQGR